MAYRLSKDMDSAESARLAEAIRAAKCLVIKIGSSLLVDANGALNRARMAGLAEDIKAARTRGQKIALVTSGAVGLGRAELKLADAVSFKEELSITRNEQPVQELKEAQTDAATLEEAQACAAIGQIGLAHGWQEALQTQNIAGAQILLGADDANQYDKLQNQNARYENARNTLQKLLELSVVPIINANDTVATQELRYGDNDRLAARVAVMVGAEALILLSDVDGLYADADFAPESHIGAVDAITAEIRAMGGAAGSALGKGGMKTKIDAAEYASAGGCHLILANGQNGQAANPIAALLDGGRATLFSAAENQQLSTPSRLTIDTDTLADLRAGGALSTTDVRDSDGIFYSGDSVTLTDPQGRRCGYGLANTSTAALAGGGDGEAVIIVHRDDLVLEQIDDEEDRR